MRTEMTIRHEHRRYRYQLAAGVLSDFHGFRNPENFEINKGLANLR
jgi:hypothetical protein